MNKKYSQYFALQIIYIFSSTILISSDHEINIYIHWHYHKMSAIVNSQNLPMSQNICLSEGKLMLFNTIPSLVPFQLFSRVCSCSCIQSTSQILSTFLFSKNNYGTYMELRLLAYAGKKIRRNLIASFATNTFY